MASRRIAFLLVVMAATARASATDLEFPVAAATDDAVLAQAMPALAKRLLADYRDDDRDVYLGNLFRIQLVAGDPAAAVATIDAWRRQHGNGPNAEPSSLSIGVRMYARALARQTAQQLSFDEAFRNEFRESFAAFDDRTAYDAAWSMGTLPAVLRRRLQAALDRQAGKATISLSDAVALLRSWAAYDASRAIATLIEPLTAEDEASRYVIEPNVLIRTKQGATLSAAVVRSRTTLRRPAALRAVIQTSLPRALQDAKYAASRGYVGVGSDTRGKRLSLDPIVLFEDDADDLWGVIDWISRQPWSDGQVGMYGGSNAGFTQWAAAKRLHPALKTIVPYCPLDPGFGLPMLNNVFITANYDVFFYLGNTKELDERFNVPSRYAAMLNAWYRSGRPYREIDQVDGIPNPWLQRFLKHPAYDAYWQGMTAYGKDYRKLNIPILAIDGYFDDGQANAVRRLQEHYRARPDAEHYLVIGPYDHFDTQSSRKSPVLRGYTIDPAAALDTPALTFEWFDYIMKHGPKPAILKDKINYEVMGANLWKGAPSIDGMSTEKLTLHFSAARTGDAYTLTAEPPHAPSSVTQRVDFADRASVSVSAYPSAIMSKRADLTGPLVFVSEPFDAPVSVDGLVSATMRVIVNKKDMDIAMVLYELTSSGEMFHMSWTLQRASFAEDMTKRRLLVPNRPQTVRLDRTTLVSRLLGKGSRLLVALDVNHNTDGQVNYGTGKDVSDESIADAKEPLVVQWLGESTITIPISREAAGRP